MLVELARHSMPSVVDSAAHYTKPNPHSHDVGAPNSSHLGLTGHHALALLETSAPPCPYCCCRREVLGTCPCDRRHMLSRKREAFPGVIFESHMANDDPMWSSSHPETWEQAEARARTFLMQLLNRPETHIAVRPCIRRSAPCNGVIAVTPYVFDCLHTHTALRFPAPCSASSTGHQSPRSEYTLIIYTHHVCLVCWCRW